MIFYADMVADLFHFGHFNYLTQIYNEYIKNTDNLLYIGIHNDNAAQSYKRLPIMTMEERIKSLKLMVPFVNKIIPNAPLNVSEEYFKKHNISYVCVPDNRSLSEIKDWYSYPLKLDCIKKFKYTHEMSTSMLLKRIIDRKY